MRFIQYHKIEDLTPRPLTTLHPFQQCIMIPIPCTSMVDFSPSHEFMIYPYHTPVPYAISQEGMNMLCLFSRSACKCTL